jgi:glycogen operon protein
VVALRARQQRNFLATLLLSLGTPMVLGGDEVGRTQDGNNNAWCQDNELSWYSWELSDAQQDLRAFARRLIRLRRAHPVFRRDRFLVGRELKGSGLPDVWWFRTDGRRMTRRDWQVGERVLGVFLNGAEIPTRSPHGAEIVDDSFLLLFNAHADERTFMLPPRRFGARWTVELTTWDPTVEPGAADYGARTEVPVPSRSITVLRRVA